MKNITLKIRLKDHQKDDNGWYFTHDGKKTRSVGQNIVFHTYSEPGIGKFNIDELQSYEFKVDLR